MATQAWLTTATGDFGVAGNWTSGVPVTGDTVEFNAGSVNVSASLNQAAKNFAGLYVSPDYSGKVGASGAGYLQCDVNSGANARLVMRGAAGSELWFNGTANNVLIDTPTVGDVRLDGGTITSLITAKATKLMLVSGLTVTTWRIGWNASQANDVLATVNTTVVMTLVHQDGGKVTASSAPTTLRMNAGTWSQVASGNITALELRGSSLFEWKHNGNTITTVEVFPGATFDASTIGAASTITNLILHSGGIAKITNKVTLTNPLQVIGPSALLYVDGGALLQQS